MLEQFSATIEKLYAAAGDRALWNDALDAVELITGSAGAVLNVIAKDDFRKSFILNGPRINNHFSEDEIEEYNRELLPHCPRVAAGIANPNLPLICDYMILSEREMDQNVAYAWYQRHGLRYFIGAPVAETGGYRMMWSVQRTPLQGHAQAEDVRMFELLKPHVARAATMAEEIGTLRTVKRFSSGVLDSLPQAVFALDAAGELQLANRAAEAMIQSHEGLRTVDRKLRTPLAAEQAQLERAIAHASLEPRKSGDLWLRVSRPNGGPPYAAFVAPLNIDDQELGVSEAKVLVVVHDTAVRTCVKAEVLTRLYGLTEAEARLASALAGGHSLESAGALLGITVATVRSELKLIFRKTGVSRQQDLVRLLTPLSMIPAATTGLADR